MRQERYRWLLVLSAVVLVLAVLVFGEIKRENAVQTQDEKTFSVVAWWSMLYPQEEPEEEVRFFFWEKLQELF